MKQKIIVIVGPTAVGKTDLSIQLAKKYNGEIISGDSMQAYKQLSIGTAKVTPDEMKNIPHHLVDFLDIHDSYSASEFKLLAQEKIDDICRRGKLPIIVGGTGLYIEGLLYDMTFGGVNSTNNRIREQLQERLRVEGNQRLWDELNQKDSIAASKIPVSNGRRIVRALEVMCLTGELFSNQEEKITEQEQQYDALVIGLTTERQVLYDRINARVDNMVAVGLLDETKWLMEQPNFLNTQVSKAIGYKELFEYVNGHESLEQALETLKQNSRRYAKRQLTWFNNRMRVTWFDILQQPSTIIEQEVNTWLKKLS